MRLSREGRIVENTWLLIPERFEDVKVDVFQVMPDHFHGILHIQGDMSTRAANGSRIMENSSLSVVMRWFKGKCTYEIRKQSPTFSWVTRYYDRILQDPEAIDAVRKYIELNPAQWKK